MKFVFYFRGKKYLINVVKTGFFRKGLGLMFRTRNTKNLLFEFSNSVTWQGSLTSWFVFFPFIALWLDKKNKVIDIKIVKPFTFNIIQKKKFNKIIELPVNRGNKELLFKLVGKNNFLLRRKFG